MVSAEDEPYRVGTIWALDLDEPTPAITPLVAATFHRAGPESSSALAGAMGAGTPAEADRRFETGRFCYAARVGVELAAYGWVSFDEEYIGELGLRLRLLPGEAYIWDCATLPVYRRKRLFSALLVYMLAELRLEPLCRVWIGANLDNVASQRGIDRAGFHRVADLLVRQAPGVRQIWAQSYPGVPDSLAAEARRVFLTDRDDVWLTALQSAKSAGA